MRKIKFRGWHTSRKQMFSAEEMARDQLTLLTTGEFINVSGADTRFSKIFPNEKFIPLQFTGLKDKNGKEIWEGDIVEIFDLVKIKIMQVIFLFGCFVLKDVVTDFWVHLAGDDCTVIGNIYENSELLTEDKDNG